MSGGCWARAARAVGPSPASATTSMSGSWPSMARRPTRTTLWSSTMRTRIFSGITQVLEADGHLDGGSLSRMALQAEAPEQRRPLAHPHQTEVTGLAAGGGLGIEPRPVVGHHHGDGPFPVGEAHLDATGPGVLDGVGEGLVADAQQ